MHSVKLFIELFFITHFSQVPITFLPRDRGDYAQFWDLECHPVSDPQQKTRIRFQLCGTVRTVELFLFSLNWCVWIGAFVVNGYIRKLLWLFCFTKWQSSEIHWVTQPNKHFTSIITTKAFFIFKCHNALIAVVFGTVYVYLSVFQRGKWLVIISFLNLVSRRQYKKINTWSEPLSFCKSNIHPICQVHLVSHSWVHLFQWDHSLILSLAHWHFVCFLFIGAVAI